ncbi:MAG TPA: hypothetical protein VJ579_05030 [Candidatus Paceibacterota bacterium]|nr:hypothetical protein [Candidatus Paceibacterota bacterium]
MSRSYNPRPWQDKTGVAFVDLGTHTNGQRLQLRKNISRAPQPSFIVQLREEWSSRRPYFIIVFSVGSVIILALCLLVYASLA